MLVKREHKSSKWVILLIVLIASYYALRVSTLVELNNGEFNVDFLSEALDNLHIITTPVIINSKTLGISAFVGLFCWMIIER